MGPRTMGVDEFRARVAAGRPNKFGAIAVVHEGIRYHSKSEFAFKMHLDLKKAEGAIDGYTRQVPFWIPAEPTASKYVLDFMTWGRSGLHFIEIKGKMTPDAKIKIGVVQHLYRIKIEVLPARQAYTWRP